MLLTGVCVLAADVFSAVGYVGASRRLHLGMLRTSLRAPMMFFDATPVGRLMNRFAKDVDVIDTMLPRTINTLIWCTFNVIATICVIAFNLPLFLLTVVPLLVFYWFIQVTSSPCLRHIFVQMFPPVAWYKHVCNAF